MTDRTAFKKTLYLFNQEANRLLSSDWEESPLPFKRFLNRIEAEPEIKAYLDDCVNNHTPEGFDAAGDVKAVAEDFGVTFVNFSTVPEEESAEVYLILKEMIVQNIPGRSKFYYCFAHGNKYPDMYKGFLNKVVRRLVANIEGYLTMIGIDMGLDGGDSVNNYFNGTVANSQFNQPIGNSTVNATQTNGLDSNAIGEILDTILIAAKDEIDDEETLEDIRDNVEKVRAQLESGEPKRGVIKSCIGFLKGVDGGVQFAAAVSELIQLAITFGFIVTG